MVRGLLDDSGSVVDSVTIEVEPIASLALAAARARVVQFMLSRPGRFDVVCTIGTAQLAVTLRR